VHHFFLNMTSVSMINLVVQQIKIILGSLTYSCIIHFIRVGVIIIENSLLQKFNHDEYVVRIISVIDHYYQL
jgi:hypothetical protein